MRFLFLPVSTWVTIGFKSSSSSSHVRTTESDTPLFDEICAAIAVWRRFENFCNSNRVINSGARASLTFSLHLVSLCCKNGGGYPLAVETLNTLLDIRSIHKVNKQTFELGCSRRSMLSMLRSPYRPYADARRLRSWGGILDRYADPAACTH